MKSTKRSLFTSALALFLCFSMLLGTTFAWFTDTVTSGNNKIVSGSLKVDLELFDKETGTWESIKDSKKAIFDHKNWEPGYTDVKVLRITNKGSLALKWDATIIPLDELTALANVIDVYVYSGKTAPNARPGRNDLEVEGYHKVGTLREFAEGLDTESASALLAGESDYLGIALKMRESAGNEYKNTSCGEFDIRIVATQYSAESEKDSFDENYDNEAQFPVFKPADVNLSVQTANGFVTADAYKKTGSASMKALAGTKVTDDRLSLNVSEMAASGSNVRLEENEVILPLDVHVDGVAPDNTKPIIITLDEAMMTGLNIGNYKLYHVEDGVANLMTAVSSLDELDAHNEFYYDPATGNVSLAMATFSEVAMVAEPPKWEGNRDYTWYTNAVSPLAEGDPDYVIANADQLAGLSAIVGGMDGQTQNSFAGKTVKLTSDINLGDKESENNPDIIFYPIGYYNSEGTYERTNTAITSGLRNFEGTFDGNGHTVSNFYHNTWEMKGDHNWYSPEEQYYRDGMGLFGRVYGGTVKNLTVKNFSSDGEIATTGVIAAYADGAKFENIAIFNCNPRVYNIGNGGIVGCVGWYAKEAGLKTTFTNITVDNSNKISALWGSYDVACGGIVGQYYPTSGQSSYEYPENEGIHFENCHISAQMDVYNDVCANYQYYAYRYTGMLIGSVRENETIGGHVYPKMDGITANGCTVHFGTWNDYYYCEIIDNTTASYTHDYQMSRLTEIKEINGTTITYLDGTTGTVPASGRANYVIVDYTKGHGTENATCYHFKDGAVWNHEDAGYHNGENGEKYIDENGDGKADLKEDKQHIYLEFNNLVTGYGWGVTSKGLTDFEGVENMDITAGDHEASVKKFESDKDALTTNREYNIGEIFSYIENCGVKVVDGAVNVTITNLDENGNVIATFTRGEKWNEGTISFENTGNIAITIQDYYFCTPTTITVEVEDRQAEVKFDVVMNNGDFLHRVGNSGTVALDKLFKAKAGVTVGTVSVTIEAVDGTGASGTFNPNTTDWTKGSIQFSGTGVVKVTITDNDYCTPTELYLEVVDAVNATTATSATSNNVVLLNDTSGTFSVSGGYTFYGNGFKVTLPTSSSSKWSGGFVGYININNGNLDNVQIIGHVFPVSNIYREQAGNETDGCTYFHNSVIINGGDCKITNSYISGSRAAVYVKAGGNILIENTTVSGGAYANIEVSIADSIVLRNITTEQRESNDSYGQNKKIIGLGIVVNSADVDVYLEGTLNQYNWITAAQWSAMLGNYENQFPKFFTDTTYESYWHYREGDTTTKYVNLTMIFACEWDSTKLHDNRTDKTINYESLDVTVVGNNGGVYSTTNLGTLTDSLFTAPDYISTEQYPFAPNYTFDFTNKNYQEVGSTNDYCYKDGEIVKISFDEGNSKIWDTSILTLTKFGHDLTYSVSMGGQNYTGKTITFTTSGNYVVTYTYTDPYNYKLDSNGNIVSYEKTYTKTVNITVTAVESASKNAEFTMGTNGQDVNKIQVGNDTYISAKNIDSSNLNNPASATFGTGATTATTQTIYYSGQSNGSWGSTVVNGITIYFPVVAMGTTDSKFEHTGSWYGCFPVFEGAISITDYADGGMGAEVTYNGSTTTLPANLSAVYPQPTFRYQGTTSKVPTTPSKMTKGTYNGKLCYTTQTDLSASNERSEEWVLAKYTYTDNAGKTYYWFVGYYCAASTNGGCVTPDTLVTLADGTQVRVDALTGNEMLLVWNHQTGTMESVPVAYIVNHDGVASECEVISLNFSNGRTVKIIGEHVFFDATLNKYVAITSENANEFIGHKFAAIGTDGNALKMVELSSIDRTIEITTVYEVVSYKHLTCFTEGILSTSAYLDPLLNVFDINEDTLAYDAELVQSDIEKYGLYTYADFEGLISEEAFELYNAAYLKIAVGKGYITWDDILELIDIYFAADVQPV